MYCETCPIRDHCNAYKEAEEENHYSYHPQEVVRVGDYSKPPCPLLAIAKAERA